MLRENMDLLILIRHNWRVEWKPKLFAFFLSFQRVQLIDPGGSWL